MKHLVPTMGQRLKFIETLPQITNFAQLTF